MSATSSISSLSGITVRVVALILRQVVRTKDIARKGDLGSADLIKILIDCTGVFGEELIRDVFLTFLWVLDFQVLEVD